MIKKSILEKFISKYNLSGLIETVIWTADDKGLTTVALTDEQSLWCKIHTPELQLEVGEYYITDTSKLRSMLGSVDEDLKVKPTRGRETNKPVSLSITDDDVKLSYGLGAEDTVKGVADISLADQFINKNYEIVIKLTPKFISTFSKACSSLKEATEYAIISNGKRVQVIVNHHPSHNRNLIAIDAETTVAEDVAPLYFSSGYTNAILAANKECDNGTLSISADGLACFRFSKDGFDSLYYLSFADPKKGS